MKLLLAKGADPNARLTRGALMNALTNLNWKNPFLYPGLKMVTSSHERFPIDQQILEQYKGTGWQPFGHIFSQAR